MKKNMIALAVAGALVAPVAMADVTISGGLQAELIQIGGDAQDVAAAPAVAPATVGTAAQTGHRNGLYAMDGHETQALSAENSGNYGFLKFAASEDLGGGMKAMAVYNMAVNVGDESNAVGTREAFVGLSAGSVGTILAGTLATPYKSSTVAYDPFLATAFQARGNYGMTFLNNGYVGNALAYANSFAGDMVKVVAAVVLDEGAKAGDPDKTNGKNAYSFSVNVAPISGLDVALAYISVSEFSDGSKLGTGVIPAADKANDIPTTVMAKDANATKIGAKYTMGAFTVAGQVEMLNKGLTGSGEKGNVVYLTGSFNVNDANSISVGLGQQDKKVTGGDDGARYMAVGFKHAFSKNTSTTIGYRVSDDMSTGGAKETAVGAGLRVNF